MHSKMDLTVSATHSNMVLQSRKSPRLPLRRNNSPFGGFEKGPMSSTSSRFNFNHLLASPPPSPSLPALIPRHGSVPPSPTPRRLLRVVIWFSGFLSVLYLASSILGTGRPVPSVGWPTHAEQEYEMVGEDLLPDFPTPVVVSDKRGRAKWTVSIPPSYEFPLRPNEYREICQQTMEVSNHVADLHSHKHVIHPGHFSYYHVDPHFMDVAEAHRHGMLSGPVAKGVSFAETMKTDRQSSIVGTNDLGSLVEQEVCKTSMTFVMETEDAGLGPTLMMLWSAYGLAQKEGRAFFIDDSRWYVTINLYYKPIANLL